MSPETTAATHDNGLPSHLAVLRASDPELAEFFERLAFEEASAHGKLETRTRFLVVLTALIAAQSLSEYRLTLNSALDNDVTPVALKEVVYQAIPYVGMAGAFDYLAATNDVLTGRGVTLPLPPQATITHENRAEKGRAVQSEIFGTDVIDGMYESAPTDEQHIQHLLSANCFGDYYTRNGLDLQTRELLTFVLIVSLGGADAQAQAHAAGNINVGNGRDRLIAVLTQILPFIGYPRTLNGLRALKTATANQ